MPAETPGCNLKVFAAGLHQLGTKCEKLAGELTAGAAPSFVAGRSWQSTAATANAVAAAASEDLIAIAKRIGTRGTDYAMAGTMYERNDEYSAAALRSLVR
ncbi:MAG: hypothetical protein QJR12_05385 [Mycobacterium sp.]|uniref:hypothetical protein n=1 Tax=Mycobacterium sp. TaxID=1785 RepID=UPI00261FE817|nr:hypothetical protein [Mycobacterium sp.]MDI3313720.1 hypothetical protein [Mycobacterium sp.]